MKMLKLSVPLWALIVSILAVAGVAAATVYWTHRVANVGSVHVSGKTLVTMEYWHNHPPVAALETIDWGEFSEGGEGKNINSEGLKFNGETLPVERDIIIENIGNTEVYVGWNLTDLTLQPDEVTITAKYETAYQSSIWIDWAENDYSMHLQTGESSGRVIFTVETVSTTPTGDFGFTLNFNSADSNTG